jgi:transposase-like protein
MQKEVKSQKQLAIEYGVCRNTFRKWLIPIEKKLKLTRKALKFWQVKMIYEFLDAPDSSGEK